MRYIACLLLILIIISCGEAPRKETPDTTEKIDVPMELHLSNAKYISPNEISVDLEMQNRSDKTVLLYERWNSWGAYQWTFNVKTASGRTINLGNPQSTWTLNFPSTFSVPAKGSYKKKCCLFIGESVDHHDLKKVWDFVPIGEGVGQKRDLGNLFDLPVDIHAVFLPAERYETDKVEITAFPNYFIEITSDHITVNKNAEQNTSIPDGSR